MSTQGTTTVDFGTSGNTDATTVITGQAAIIAGSFIEAWLYPVATADHNVDEHRVEEIAVMADTIVAGTGFTIFARTRNVSLFGKYNVAWVWV